MKRFVFAALLALCASRAEAQLGGGFGLGFGSLACERGFTCRRYSDGAPTSVSAWGYIADQVTPHIQSGVELNMWFWAVNPRVRMGTLGWVILARPWLTSGLRFKGGLGLAANGTDQSINFVINDWAMGVMATAGVGYELAAFKRASVSFGFNLVVNGPFENSFDDNRYSWQATFGVIPLPRAKT